MFLAQARRYGERTRYRAVRAGAWRDVSWADMARAVREIAAGLVRLGVAAGDRVAIYAATRPEWVEIDLAIQAAGGVTVPIYPSSIPAEVAFLLADSGARIAFAENAAALARLRQAIAAGPDADAAPPGAVAVHRLLCIDPAPAPADADATSLAELRALGRDGAAAAEIDRRVAAIAPGDVATIVYTSGTTGVPKGVVQTHANHLAMLASAARLGLLGEGDVDFLFLPLAHSFARFTAYFAIHRGSTTAFARSLDTLAEDLPAARPHVIAAVPRIYEKLHARIHATVAASGAPRRALFGWAMGIGRRRSAHLQAREAPPPLLELQYRIADRLVFARLRRLLGGRVRLLISGAAPLAREIMEFFHAAGLLVLEGYGLTETTPALTMNRPDDFKFGSVGRPMPGVEIRIADDGEILARGPNVASGYYRRPAETAESWAADGWFHTGDIGELDAEGFLRITDRKKELIKTAGGKYVAPQKIENLLKLQPHVSQAVVVGDRRKYCVALIALDPDTMGELAAAAGLPPGADARLLARSPAVLRRIEEEVAAVNAKLASFETIKAFRILPRELTLADGELTPSLKVKRRVVAARYGALIEDMYP